MKKRTDKWLQQRMDIYNREYFNSAIPSDIKTRFGKTDKHHDAHYNFKRREIMIAKELNGHDTAVLIALLHEMAHAALEKHGYVGTAHEPSQVSLHGMLFQAEIVRLFNTGAYDSLL